MPVFYPVMKTSITHHKVLIPLLSLTLLTAAGLRAQTGDGTNSTTPQTNATSNTGGNAWHHHGGWDANLTPEERTQLKNDYAQIKDNAQLVAAKQAVHQAQQALEQTRNTLLLQADPSVQPILTKIQQARQSHQNNNTNGN
jgi:hypothetical protein